ncbi:MAG: sulfonate ABC transporter ATP-binding protein [Thalassospira sp.]|uniref:ABC transporter ATP-binding protein n=1 Tax=Thalassospira TaxID=168934 RepID=UPI000C3CF906|nr:MULTISPECIES: ABC transporter ATP-binding protein [unclassified Thalassospira]MBE69210.1 sulfonate ABC transporter ATP-binding protein [Thalassospira sp.]QPO10295.1 ABC transporter ATP-binding protein [Thalassospira sp. A40-3]|tara:strand:+ start:619 stop:1419 length:801 start_codon:yes stop_codon:yes gene_type:complete
MSMLSLRDITVRFEPKGKPPVLALDDVSLDVANDTFSVIVGPSGCGKSTLLRLVAGLETPTSGRLELDGQPINGPSADRGMVFQSYTLFPWLTVRENVMFGPKLKGLSKSECEDIADDLIKAVHLDGFEKSYPKELSGGMRQRVALARALANDPRILLMDEPFGALDSQTRQMMQELLLDVWQSRRKTVLFITHDIDEAIFLGDEVHVMSARPGLIKQSLDISIPRPRHIDALTSPEFMDYKRTILSLMHDEAIKAEDAANQRKSA